MTDNKEFAELVEELVKQADELESECINQSPIPIWKLRLKLTTIRELVYMAENVMEN